MPQPLVYLYHAGKVATLVRSDADSNSVFGGPIEFTVEGIAENRSLHQIAYLHSAQLASLEVTPRFRDLPLLYGMRYSGCRMEYRIAPSGISVLAISPDSPAEDWPYLDYPPVLPYYGLEVAEVRPQSWQAFSERAANLPEQSFGDLVAIVPPPRGLGFTLWGRSGDAEEVTLVFEWHLADDRVVAYNVCS